MSKQSNLDVVYDLIVSKTEPVSFKEILEYVIEKQELDPVSAKKMIGQLYTNLSLDGRFVTTGENCWTLRDRVKFENHHIDMNAVYRDVERRQEVDDDEKEYDKILDGEGDDEEDGDTDENEEYSEDSDY